MSSNTWFTEQRFERLRWDLACLSRLQDSGIFSNAEFLDLAAAAWQAYQAGGYAVRQQQQQHRELLA